MASGCGQLADHQNSSQISNVSEEPIEIAAENVTNEGVAVTVTVFSGSEQSAVREIEIPGGKEKIVNSPITEAGGYRLVAETEDLRDEFTFRVEKYHIERNSAITITVRMDEIRTGIQE